MDISTIEVQNIKVKNNLINKRFIRLLVIDRANDLILNDGKLKRVAWNCLCDCGKLIVVPSCALVTGNTKSCGCIKIELSKEKVKIIHKTNIKHEPNIFSAKQIWWATYKELDGVTFEDFLTISQNNCFYCNVEPNTKFNTFIKTKRNHYLLNINEGDFLYNGLDRIDSNKQHTIDNVVACCPLCNRSKSDNTFQYFLQHIKNLIFTDHISFDDFRKQSLAIEMCDLNKLYYGSTVKCTFSNYHRDDGDILVEQFYQLSQMSCYYCGKSPSQSNKANKIKRVGGEFHYNGLDRIDSSLPHNYSNVVACCYNCNRTKMELPFCDIISWIDRLKNNYDSLLEKVSLNNSLIVSN